MINNFFNKPPSKTMLCYFRYSPIKKKYCFYFDVFNLIVQMIARARDRSTSLLSKRNSANRKNKRYNNENNLAAIDCKQTNYRPSYIQVWYRNRKANWNVFSIIDIRVSIRMNSICQLATSSWYRNRIYTCVTPSSVIFHERSSIRSRGSSSSQ